MECRRKTEQGRRWYEFWGGQDGDEALESVQAPPRKGWKGLVFKRRDTSSMDVVNLEVISNCEGADLHGGLLSWPWEALAINMPGWLKT